MSTNAPPKEKPADVPPISLPTLTRGKLKTIARRHASSTLAPFRSEGGPPDASIPFFSTSADDDESDDDAFNPTVSKPAFRPPVVKQPSDNDDASAAVDPLDSFMQTLNESAPPAKRPRPAERPLDDELPDSPLQTEESLTAKPRNTRAKRVYEPVDHSAIPYPPFEKNLYIEVPELAAMSASQVSALRQSLDNTRVRGRACPRPITSWSQCGLAGSVLALLKRSGYTHATPIQAQAIPCIMSGRDVIGVARTGSGKTLAFMLPLLRHIARRPRAVAGEGPSALVVAPTRELAIQIYGEGSRFAKPLSIHCVCAYGGSALKDQIAELKRGADVVICTPGRMIDLLSMNSGRICNLRRVSFVVLDEADRMFDMGFEPQLTRIVENVRPDRQTVMFSATFPIPVEKLARKILTRPVEITVGGKSVAASTIDQHVEVRPDESKFFRLLELLGVWYERGSTLVFVDRQENADRIFRDLSKARYKCLSLHGGMDQADRDSTIVDFKNGDIKVLVATSVAARGLDVKNLTLVVNFDVPSHYEDYVHRVGRTGRAGRAGTAYTFITPEQDALAPDMVKALELSARAKREGNSSIDDNGVGGASGGEVSDVVPEELRKLADAFEQKRKAGIVKYAGASGYGGRGFKFDENDEYVAAKSAIRKMQARQYGIEDDVAEEEESDGGDGEHGKLMDVGKKVEDVTKDEVSGKVKTTTNTGGLPIPKIALSERQVDQLLEEAVAKAEANASAQNADETIRRQMIAKAKAQVLSLVTMQKAQTGASGAFHAGASSDKVQAKEMGEAGIDNDENEEVSKGTSKFSDELEINDYPQHARWQVTRKGSLNDVEEFTGCVVTTRGNFYPVGRNPPAGERKLHLLIEASTRRAVETAKRDIRQKLEEAASVTRPGDNHYSKYSVV